jgi:hypothetical protein
MTKIIQFIDETIPFLRDSYSQAIKDLPLIDSNIEVVSYSYHFLRKNLIQEDTEPIVLFLEAGQLQPKHSNCDFGYFKWKFPNSKIVVWSSDLQYYLINENRFQFDGSDKVDLVFECTPSCQTWWSAIGVNSTSIPWTISKSLYKKLTELAGEHINFYRKKNDFICLANFSGEYRKSLLTYLDGERYSYIVGGKHDDQNLDQTYENFLNSWICLGTSSHNRPELNLPGQRTMKGYRDAMAIALNCLLIYDDDKDVDATWTIKGMPRWKFDDFSLIPEILEYYKYNLVAYRDKLREQQVWLSGHLLDDMIYFNLKKFGII